MTVIKYEYKLSIAYYGLKIDFFEKFLSNIITTDIRIMADGVYFNYSEIL